VAEGKQNRMPLACDSAVEVVPSWEERGTQPPEGIVSVANKGLAGARFWMCGKHRTYGRAGG